MTPTAKKYKQEAESARSAKESAERQLKALQDQKKREEEARRKNWHAIIYCENCMEVNSVSIPPLIGTTKDDYKNVKLKDTDCITCRFRGGLHLVRKVNNC